MLVKPIVMLCLIQNLDLTKSNNSVLKCLRGSCTTKHSCQWGRMAYRGRSQCTHLWGYSLRKLSNNHEFWWSTKNNGLWFEITNAIVLAQYWKWTLVCNLPFWLLWYINQSYFDKKRENITKAHCILKNVGRTHWNFDIHALHGIVVKMNFEMYFSDWLTSNNNVISTPTVKYLIGMWIHFLLWI